MTKALIIGDGIARARRDIPLERGKRLASAAKDAGRVVATWWFSQAPGVAWAEPIS